jgi:hypothetical protein
MEGKKNWYGIECEGRLHGLFTHFVRYEIDSEIDKRTQHIYFTKEFLTSPAAAEMIEEMTFYNYVVSVEVNKDNWQLVSPNMKVRCHLIYRVIDDNPFELKPTDSIFIDKVGMYNVLCFTKHNALVVKPADYSKDFL